VWQGEKGHQRPFQGQRVDGTASQRAAEPQLASPAAPLVARYADACNIPPSPELRQNLELPKRM
jgi:hypothetical protein